MTIYSGPVRGRRAPARIAGLLLPVTLAGCQIGDAIRERLRPATPYESYAERLRAAGLDSTALGREWAAAAPRALRAPVRATLPFRETGYFAAHEARAVAYHLQAREGQRLVVTVETQGAEPFAMFVDLYDADELEDGGPRRVAGLQEGESRLTMRVREDGAYLLRLQPELLRGGRYVVTVQTTASLAFPVQGRDMRAVKSFWGAERDAGRRSHQGIDIFAPRGTPVLAAADGWVTRVGNTGLGGKVVWQRDEEGGQSLYYAHLDSQIARPGEYLRRGQVLGLVGNTGNARSTPPHLHFGIYRRGRGAVDPYPFVYESREQPPALVADAGWLGELVRTRAAAALSAAPSTRADTVADIPARTVLHVAGAVGAWYRVRLPDGAEGYLPSRLAESAASPVATRRPTTPIPLRDRPAAAAAVIDSIPSGTALSVLGRFADWTYVAAPNGQAGWVN